MANSFTLRSPIRIGLRRIRKLKFRPIDAKLVHFAEELSVGLDARNCGDIERAVAAVSFATDLPVNVAWALSVEDLVGALESWKAALVAYVVERAP